MPTDFKLLKFDVKNKKSNSNNIYEEKYPYAKDFIHAIMISYNLSLRTIAQFSGDRRYKLTDNMFIKFLSIVEKSETYSKEFRQYRRKILVRCNNLDFEELQMKEKEKDKYEIKLKKIL
ncbi:MAG: hypothetical protein WAR79_11870 [Melioribacteraceae bacterium]